MNITINKQHKSIPAGITFDLPKFCVITGKNGSGKSHLLEAIANNQISSVTDNGVSLVSFHLIGFGGLNPQVDERCDPQQITQNSKQWWSQIEGMQNNLKNARSNGEDITNPIEQLLPRWGHNPQLVSISRTVMTKAAKDFECITEDDVYFNLNLNETSNGSLFISQLAAVFKTYHTRYIKNRFRIFQNQQDNTTLSTLTDEEFIKKHGPKPWELVNEILARAGLPYKVISPELIDFDSTYTLRLIDKTNDTDISVNDLSTGEKVLMSLALAIYNTHESGTRPDILILDEPDAPLHPEYSKLLLETLTETIVKRANVRVIVTTHSPSTVAICPNNALYEMNKATKIPEMISISRGLEVLTEGIPHLKVSIEGRRQIFVESKFDVLYYQKLFQVVFQNDTLPYQPIFLEPNSSSSNCTDVITMAMKLSEAGSDLVRGIVDWDGERTNSPPIFVLGQGNRYSIENYILDPLYVGLALVRSGKKSLSDFLTSGMRTYVDVVNMTQGHAQIIANHILNLIGISLDNLIACQLQNGWSLQLPNQFLVMRGHDYESQLLEAIPELNSISKGNGEAALKLGVLQVIEEFPRFLSIDIAKTFKSLL